MAQVHAERLGMSDHSWVHTQIVLNIALRLLRLLVKAGVEPAVVADHGMSPRDAEVVVAGGALLHDVGMSIHRADHEAYSLFLANGALERLLADSYRQPERAIVTAEILHAIIGHRRRGEPYTLEAGVVRVADALDMAQGRTRLPIEAGQEGIHSISAAAVDEVRIEAGEERPVRIEIELNNSAGIFQVDDLLATKIRDTPAGGQGRSGGQDRGRDRETTAERLQARLSRTSRNAPGHTCAVLCALERSWNRDRTITRIAKKAITPKQKKVTVLSVVGPARPTPFSASAKGAASSVESSAARRAAAIPVRREGAFTPGNLAHPDGANRLRPLLRALA